MCFARIKDSSGGKPFANGREAAMQFRWVIGIALWTILSGPIFAPPQSVLRPPRPQATAALEHGKVASPPVLGTPIIRR